MNSNALEITKNQASAIITINRPHVYNALNRDTRLEFINILNKLEHESEIKTIIITGQGKAFCTGQDLNDRANQDSHEKVDLGTTLEEEWNPLIEKIRDSKKPIIAAVNGVTAGAGLSIVFACDMIYSKKALKFVGGFSKIGLCPDAGSLFNLQNAIGYQKTFEFFVTNNPLISDYLHERGLINQITDEPVEAALQVSKTISHMAPLSIATIKKHCQKSYELNFKEMLNLEVLAQRFLGNSEDFKEGVNAFLEKRDPNFTGK